MLAAVAVVVATLWFSLKPHRHAGQVAVTTATWHPEPAFLFQHRTELQLDARQLRHIQIVERDWNLKKAAFDIQFKTYDSDSAAALDALSNNKAPSGGEYGKLLNSFEKARQAAWASATGTLHPDQVVELDRVREKAQTANSK